MDLMAVWGWIGIGLDRCWTGQIGGWIGHGSSGGLGLDRNRSGPVLDRADRPWILWRPGSGRASAMALLAAWRHEYGHVCVVRHLWCAGVELGEATYYFDAVGGGGVRYEIQKQRNN